MTVIPELPADVRFVRALLQSEELLRQQVGPVSPGGYGTSCARKYTFSETNPIGSMYGIFTYIWLIFMVHVGKYTIHGCNGNSKFAPENGWVGRRLEVSLKGAIWA